MPNPLPDYYAILNLKPAATQTEIKQRYRELARRYHPDVNHSPDAAHKIKVVNEAHRVLGDPERRSKYDAERILNPPPRRHESPAQRERQSTTTRPTASPDPQRARPQRASPRVEFNGFGRVTPESAPPRRPVAQPNPQKVREPDNSTTVNRLVSEAQIAFLTRNYADAVKLSIEALALDRTAAGAHEVLGDLAAVRGNTESAIKSYSYAIQFNPRSYSAQGKLDRLIGRKPAATSGPAASRRGGGPSIRPALSRKKREVVMGLASVGLFAGGCAVVAVFGQNPGLPFGGSIPWLTSLSPNLMIALALEGIIGGMLMAFYGRLWPIKQELTADGRTGKKAPLLVILALFSVVWFYASMLVYIGVAVGRNRTSMSTVRIYSMVLVFVVLFTVMTGASERGAWLETAAFAGNILFPAALLGWYLGDCVRLRPSGV